MPKLPLAVLLSFNGGYVDSIAFVALAGLFTAHVTGNFVTLGASIAVGTGGALAQLLALPLFCIVIVLVRLLSQWLDRRRMPDGGFNTPHVRVPHHRAPQAACEGRGLQRFRF